MLRFSIQIELSGHLTYPNRLQHNLNHLPERRNIRLDVIEGGGR